MGYLEILLIIFALLILAKHVPLFLNPKGTKARFKKLKFSDEFYGIMAICMGFLSYLMLAYLFVLSNPKIILLAMFATFLFMGALLASNPKLYRDMKNSSLKQPDSWFRPISLISILLALLTLYAAFYL
tara:strand:- start:12690 stop:13076 length:387 start_codon:yes stop_codon:yes gene_type:complete